MVDRKDGRNGDEANTSGYKKKISIEVVVEGEKVDSGMDNGRRKDGENAGGRKTEQEAWVRTIPSGCLAWWGRGGDAAQTGKRHA